MKSKFKKFTNVCIFILSFLLICPIYNSYASNNANYESKNSQQFAISSANVGDGFSEAFVNGGVNDYAYSRSGIENLRTYYSECENAVVIGTGAAVLHGPIGAVLGAIGACSTAAPVPITTAFSHSL